VNAFTAESIEHLQQTFEIIVGPDGSTIGYIQALSVR
jgi:hypothetical protein